MVVLGFKIKFLKLLIIRGYIVLNIFLRLKLCGMYVRKGVQNILPKRSFVFLALSDETATIRVTNLSEDTRESDLQDLFRPFGSISRIYLAKDKNTGQSKVGPSDKKKSYQSDTKFNGPSKTF